MPVFDGRGLCGGLPVDENARRLSNCFHAERQLLHCLSGALPRVASFELKILLGTRIWSIGQTLSEYSRRLSELRAYGDFPARPGEVFESLLDEMDRAPSPGPQLSWIYHRFVPALRRTYDSYIAECDPLLDEPTVLMLRAARIAHEESRAEILEWVSEDRDSGGWTQHLDAMLQSLGPIERSPLRARQARHWDDINPIDRFERPAHFTFGPDHGIDSRAIYGTPDEFYFPLDLGFRRHFLHHMVDAEMVAAELMACNIHEFPTMPLRFHIDMARQVWDEVRHARVQWEMLKDLQVPLGSFPVYHGYDMALYRRGLLDRLILFNRLGEAGAAQRHLRRSRVLRDQGLEDWANLFDYLHADEIPHVANGNRWARHLFTGTPAEFSSYCSRLETEFQSEFEFVKGETVA